MKTRESGTPKEELWATFFDAPSILRTLKLGPACSDVVEFGFGYGTLAILAARMTSGSFCALDIKLELIVTVAAKAQPLQIWGGFFPDHDTTL